MKKLIVMTMLAGLVAVGCASRENRGGTSETDNTGTSGQMQTAPSSSGQYNNNQNKSNLNDTNNPSGSGTAPGGTSSGSSSSDKSSSSSNPSGQQ